MTQQSPTQRLELRVGPGQDRLATPPRTGSVAVPHGPGQHRGLVGPVADGDGGLVARRPHRGLRRAAQQPPGRGQHLRRRSEVGAHVQHRAAGQVLADGIDQAGIGAVPAVDGLVRVTDHHQRRVRSQPGAQQSELQRVDVLELVDEHVLVQPAVGRRVLGLGGHQPQGAGEHVVEIEHPSPALGRLVVGVELGETVGSAPRRPPARGPRLGRVLLRDDETGPAPADLVDDAGNSSTVGLGAQLGDEPAGVLEDPGRSAAGVGGVAAELGQRHRVERPRPHLVVESEPAQAGPQLAGRPPGERHREGAPGIGLALAGLPGDAAGQHPGLARAGAGDDAHRRRPGRHRVALLNRQPGQQRVFDVGHHPTLRRRPTRGERSVQLRFGTVWRCS